MTGNEKGTPKQLKNCPYGKCIQEERISILEKADITKTEVIRVLDERIGDVLNEIKGLRRDLKKMREKEIEALKVSEGVQDEQIKQICDATIEAKTSRSKWEDRLVGAAITIVAGTIMVVLGTLLH